ncbi:carboxypeptidase-like regulatory domain-containing protein [Sphingobacterium sp. GVS05A]|uniref:carboxypeptidase-like regulatory domain-containing protein n=1 Tax=Sphingobacterium sp. GVS05A TaxID=2862679 RepID=UPI001CC18069|nr:carboxypeptidase-like regulatory domain-containing protein [Sphingobacterium sp. GVS05A]
MNKREMMTKVSERSKVSPNDCEKVLDALESVLKDEFSERKGLRSLFLLVYKMLTLIKNKMILILLGLFISTSVYSQQTTQNIRGVVNDYLSGKPLTSVSLSVIEYSNVQGTTDVKGQFVIQNIPVGRYTIQAKLFGYEPILIKEVLLNSGKEVFLEIGMHQSTTILDEVVITPRNNKDQLLNKMALTGARSLRMEEASRYAGGLEDPARLLSSFAGISANMGNNGISVHGNAPSLLQWRMEGVEIPNPNHFADISILGGGILSSLSSNVLGPSGFYSSAFPAEYNNAVSGVFDMKMRNGNNQNYEHTFQLGLLGLDFASEGPFSPKNNASYLINYRYSTTGLMHKLGGGDQQNQLLDYQDLNFKLNVPTQKSGVFSIWGTGLIDKFSTKKEDESAWTYSDDGKHSEMRQTSTATGVNHLFYFDGGGLLRTTLASTFSKNDAKEQYYDNSAIINPHLELDNRFNNLILTSSFDKMYSDWHSNKTGFSVTNMRYNMHLELAPNIGKPLQTLSQGKGNTYLTAVYSSSLFKLNTNLTATLGINSQLLTLNNSLAIEPRVSLKWQSSSKISLAMAYGLHSRIEKLDVYFVKDKITGQLLNKDLDFTKTHHFSMSYNYKINENMNLKVEPYFQYLFNVPVIADSSYSVLNRSLFYVEDALLNNGRGRNVGIDMTLERYLSNGYYYLLTSSLFDSKYKGGDGIWHNTKYNSRFIVNVLAGKEWTIRSKKRDILGVNLKLTLQGGQRYSPVDEASSLLHTDREVQYDESQAYAKQFDPLFVANYTITYRMNRSKRSHEFAVKLLNATGTKEYYGHAYNLNGHNIETKKQATSLFNVLYRIDF